MNRREGGSGGRGYRVIPDGNLADDGKRTESEWTLFVDGIEETGVPGGEGKPARPDGRVADDGKRSEAEWTLCNAGIKGEGGSGGRGYRDHPGPDRTLGRRIGKKWFQKWILILHDLGILLGV